ncbi:MAG: Na/Pi symporter [Acidimicrobiaceae bacterium]|nr:Na/Pi symporter [Acidimicrobiaceae bacterium]
MAQTTTPLASREMPTGARAVLVVTLIYIFLVGVGLLEGGIKVMGADTQAQLFEGVNNPLAGLFVGILGTVLVQSSSASTSVIVGLVASGALGVDAAVPMIMGANIGTTVTNTLVSLGSIRQSEDFKRAFAAATVHDFFNLLAVMILLPFELLTGWLSRAAESISEQLVGAAGSEWKSPVKKWVKEPVNWLRDGYSNLGLEENVLGTIMVITGIGIVLLALTFITKNMRRLVADRVERSLNAVLGSGGGSVAMLLGMIITISVQSSSITTSIMVPLAAAGVVSIHNIYPVTLGANVGTTITALLAALAASKPEALTIGLVHTLFNVGAIAILYPYKRVREIPIRLAQGLAQIAVTRQAVAIGYVVVMFIVIPLVGVAVFR